MTFMNGPSNSQGLPDIPPFSDDVPTAPLLRISLSKLLAEDKEEQDRCWKACCDLGFFYLDCRTTIRASSGSMHGRVCDGEGNAGDDDGINKILSGVKESYGRKIDGEGLLRDAAGLFEAQKKFWELPVQEKVKYDFKDQGSYFGYKGYGDGIIDSTGTKDRNEFYNVSKDDILSVTPPLPAPAVLQPYRPLLHSYISHSHAVVTLILNLLNDRLGLPEGRLASLHRLNSVSGDQVRFIRAPPQPPDDRRQALGAHTDFGSVTILFNRIGGLQVLLPRHIVPVPPKAEADSGLRDHDGAGQTNGNSDENWAYVRPLPGHAIVNLGDALVKFSAGILRSNIHRVISPPGAQGDHTRYSLVYFARPEDDVILKALRGAKSIDMAAEKNGIRDEEEINSKDWVIRRALGRRGVGSWDKSKGTEAHSRRKEAL